MMRRDFAVRPEVVRNSLIAAFKLCDFRDPKVLEHDRVATGYRELSRNDALGGPPERTLLHVSWAAGPGGPETTTVCWVVLDNETGRPSYADQDKMVKIEGEIEGDSHQIWRIQIAQVTVTSL